MVINMKLKELQDAMISAMKAKDKFRKDAIAALVSAVKKKGIDAGSRVHQQYDNGSTGHKAYVGIGFLQWRAGCPASEKRCLR